MKLMSIDEGHASGSITDDRRVSLTICETRGGAARLTSAQCRALAHALLDLADKADGASLIWRWHRDDNTPGPYETRPFRLVGPGGDNCAYVDLDDGVWHWWAGDERGQAESRGVAIMAVQEALGPNEYRGGSQ